VKESTRGPLFVVARTLIALTCVVAVVIARASAGWGSLAVMLVGLAVLLGLLADYNRDYQ
jgi:p-aminobenzoyl-glutamate transporter AbgT